jgi:hypothetical protein
MPQEVSAENGETVGGVAKDQQLQDANNYKAECSLSPTGNVAALSQPLRDWIWKEFHWTTTAGWRRRSLNLPEISG